LALAMMVAFLLLTLVLRAAIQLRETGSSGLLGVDRDAGAVAWVSGALFVGGIALAVASPLFVAAGAIRPISSLDAGPAHGIGIALAALGILGTFAAQMGMGSSWRVGVSADQDTALVTGGLFSLCRNPIYTAMVIAWSGFALIVPTAIGIAAVAVVLAGLEMQVRMIEEPHMRRAHGGSYGDYARRVGRFLPGIGRTG
jgi:protein-S-isoprenylcysteine O-methyltransferase Ste14